MLWNPGPPSRDVGKLTREQKFPPHSYGRLVVCSESVVFLTDVDAVPSKTGVTSNLNQKKKKQNTQQGTFNIRKAKFTRENVKSRGLKPLCYSNATA